MKAKYVGFDTEFIPKFTTFSGDGNLYKIE